MNTMEVATIMRDLLLTALVLTLPSVAASLLVGGVISVLQTVTSIQEQTLSFAPRIIAVAVVVMFTLPWSLRMAMGFTSRVIYHMLEAVR
ncbi:flagellar biosynthetic protein FliQ [Planctomicrobium piriforme]|uniref:Flagellar biosynthetic protein FliQ n=1 Tax=Planctomicrobium piriforme TaxID=1576369 RepID=A0A1I3GRL9_9PLAN|nr:flagellar biosynthetic protein FliQ [Planctomicrobium piriforme]SFI26185.1 flagellar biosynthetic protein FliQ [Planctomicrobium piriforme]